jgi:prephenate dehydrogenase
MGGWFAKFLSQRGHPVMMTGRRPGPLRRASLALSLPAVPYGARCDWADAVVLAVPPDSVEDVAQKYDRLLRADCLLVDISSVKGPIVKFLRSQDRPALSMHPFFGPAADSVRGRSVAVVYPPRLSGRSRQLVQCFSRAGARVVRCTPEVHDLAISYTLALPHLLGAVFASSIAISGLRPHLLADLGGTSFRRMYSLAKSVGEESPVVYASIQLAHPSYPRALARAVAALERVRNELSKGEARAFLRLLRDASGLKSLREIDAGRSQ